MLRFDHHHWLGFTLLTVAMALSSPPARAQGAPIFTLFGTVDRTDLTAGTPTLDLLAQTANDPGTPAVLTLRFIPKSRLTLDGFAARPLNFRSGDVVQAQVALGGDGSWQILALDAATPQPRQYLTGLLTALSADAAGPWVEITIKGPRPQTIRVPVDASTMVRQDGAPTDLPSLRIGWLTGVLAAVSNSGGLTAVRVDAVPPPVDRPAAISGIVSGIDLANTSLLIRRSTGEGVRVRLTAATVWHPTAQRAIPLQVQIGDEALATGQQDSDGSIVATSAAAHAPDIALIQSTPALYHVLGVDPGSGEVIIGGFNGSIVVVELAPAVVLYRDGQPADVSGIQVGDGISLRGFALAAGGWSCTYAQVSSAG